MEALNKVKGLLKCKKIKKTKMDLLVIRVNKRGDLCESAPCFHCTKELHNNINYVQIDKLYYSRSDGSITCVKFSDWMCCETYHISKGWKWLSVNNCSC